MTDALRGGHRATDVYIRWSVVELSRITRVREIVDGPVCGYRAAARAACSLRCPQRFDAEQFRTAGTTDVSPIRALPPGDTGVARPVMARPSDVRSAAWRSTRRRA